jgi:hypothetical protein
MSMKNRMLLAGATLALSACGTTSSTQEPPLKPIEGVAASTGSCPVLASRNWGAKLTRVAGKLKLTIDGEVDLPTPGFTPQWREGLSDRANPPGMQVLLSFEPPPGDEMVMQVVSIHRVHYEATVSSSHYRHILVRCGDAALVQLSEIQVQP